MKLNKRGKKESSMKHVKKKHGCRKKNTKKKRVLRKANKPKRLITLAEKNRKKHFAYEVLVWLALTAVVMYIFRLWPIVLLVIFAMFIMSIHLLILSSKKVKSIDQEPSTELTALVIEQTEKDVIELAYSVILKRITQMICMEYPDARWVWETSNAKQRIKNGETVFILLNRAGGYRRARVVIQNLQVVAIDYQSDRTENGSMIMVEEMDDEDELIDEEPVENYELMAFEWVEAHTLELNDRCNEAIGAGLTEILLTPLELPVKESWPDVCNELEKIGLVNVKSEPEGITIRLSSELQKGNEE